MSSVRVGSFSAVLLAAALAACAGAPGPAKPSLPAQPPPGPVIATGGPGRPDHVVLVSVAGLTPDRYLPGPGQPSMPTLTAAARRGVAAEWVETVSPASPAPVDTALLTGTTPAVDGIAADHPIGDHGVRMDRGRHASELLVSTLWERVGRAGYPVGSLDWPVTLGAAIPLLLPATPPGAEGEGWIQLLTGAASPSILEEATSADPRAALPGPQRDAFLVSAACKLLRAPKSPRLLLLRLRGAERVSEIQGPWRAAVDQAFGGVDAQIARLTACVSQAGLIRDTAFVVVGDRAIQPVHSALRPNAALAGGGLIDLGIEGRIDHWDALARSNGRSAFVYARTEKAALRARGLLAKEAKRTHAFRVVSAQEMIDLGADKDAWFGLEAKPGFSFVDDALGPAVSAAAVRGAGGALTPAAAGSPGFVAWGRGWREPLRVPQMRQIDVAPTLALLLDVSLPDATGEPMPGLLRLSIPKQVPGGAPPSPGSPGAP